MEEKLGDLEFFSGRNMGGLKMPKDDLWGVFNFLLSSIPTECLSIKGPDFDSVLHKVVYCVALKQFNQHFDKKI